MPVRRRADLAAARAPRILVIEGDADRLQREGHTRLVRSLRALSDQLVKQKELRLARIQLRSDEDVHRLTRLSSEYDSVMLLAHGNPNGFVAAPAGRCRGPNSATFSHH